jgi:hypothetical protein
MNQPTAMKRTVVWLTKQQVQALTKLSKESMAPVSAIVRHAVTKFLQHKQQRGGSKKNRI